MWPGIVVEHRPLILIAGLGTALRLVAAMMQGNDVRPLPGVFDQLSYHELATRVIAGHGFSFGVDHWPATPAGQPTAHWSYLYTTFLAAVYWILGVHPLVPRVLQAVVTGIVHPLLAFAIAKEAFDTRVALATAAMTAAYAYFVYYSAGLLTESFYFVSVLWTLAIALRIGRGLREEGVRARDWALLGAAIGIAALLRQVFLLTVPIVLGWLWLQQRSRADRLVPLLRGIALALVTSAALIAPCTIRNVLAFDTFALLNTNAGFAFYWGNHPVHGTTFQPLLAESRRTYGDLIPPDLRGMNEAVLDRALLGRGLSLVVDDPVRFLRLSASRTIEFLKFWPSTDSSTISNLARVGSFGLVLPFWLYGGWLWATRLRHHASRAGRATVNLLCAWAACYALVHLASWTLIRYRLPIDAVLMPIAAAGVVSVFGRVGSTRVR